MNQLTTVPQFDPLISAVLDGLDNPHTKRKYRLALSDFLAWYVGSGLPSIDRITVQKYKSHMLDKRVGGVAHRLTAIRKLAKEAYHAGAIDDRVYLGIMHVPAPQQRGKKVGNWLTKREAIKALRKPDTTTLKGLRDRAVLAVFLGAGLRRSEAVDLTWEHIQQREGRWAIVDIQGKGNKTRTIPIASWVAVALHEWKEAAGREGGRVFVPINRGDNVTGDSVSAQALRDVTVQYSGLPPHDLRRTYAKLAHNGNADLIQISLSLGHESIDTTKRYIGAEQDFTNAPSDKLGLKLL